MSFIRYNRRDWLCTAAITLIALILAVCGLQKGLANWGDDHAAYISEGIAIADGRLAEQAKLNYTLHPTPLPDATGEEGLVYVWGYPLMLSAVYRIVGFDREAFTSIIWYKLPLAACYALTAGVMFLLMRRRFARRWAAFLALVFIGSGNLFGAENMLYSDLPFLLFSVLTLLMVEVFATHSGEPGRNVVYALLYGAAMWFTRELRLNGTALCGVVLMGHALWLVSRRRALRARDLWVHALPYIAFIVLCVVTERVLLMPATSNSSDVARADAATIRYNLRYYASMVYKYLDGLCNFQPLVVGAVLSALCAVGVLTHGLRENLHMTVLMAGTLVVAVLLPYRQGLRYIYNILPVLVMFVAYGGRAALGWLCARLPARRKTLRMAVSAVCAAVLLLTGVRLAMTDINNLRHWGEKGPLDAYSEQAVEAYHYVRDNVTEDEITAFAKPRLLYLNTGRMSFRPDRNGHKLSDADYFLLFKYQDDDYDVPDAKITPMETLFENDMFVFSRIIH